MNATWLIAGREFRAYVCTASFWIALAFGPLLAFGAAALVQGGANAAAPATLTLKPGPGGAVEARFSRNFPASDATKARLLQVIAADGRMKGAVRPAPSEISPASDPRALPRFAMTLTLWIVLTGSLGMLLQAVVRERANRALESLLAAARPMDIVLGKLAGVGAVSALVVGAWLAAGAAAALGTGTAGPGRALLAAFCDLPSILSGVALYVLAFAFYGLAIVAIGARARDNADAQNLARPMFAVLLAVFFATLAAAGGAHGLDGLVFLPPFTPFMLLMHPPGPAAQTLAFAILAAAVVVAGRLAERSLRLDIGGRRRAAARTAPDAAHA